MAEQALQQHESDIPEDEETKATPQPDDAAAQQEGQTDQLDYEDEMLRQAKEEAESEGMGAPEEGEKPKDGDDQPKPDGKADAEAGKPKDGEEGQKADDQEGQVDVPMIPKPRLDELTAKHRQELDQALQTAAYWKGQFDASQQHQQQSRQGEDQQQQQPEPTPEERIAELRQQKLALAKKYDDGDLNTQEWEAEKDKIEDQVDEIRLAALRERQEPTKDQQQPQQQTNEDLYLDRLTAELEEKHPYSTEIPADDPRWKFLEGEAYRQLRDEGANLRQGAAGVYQVRERMAQLTDQYGPIWTGKTPDQVRGGNAGTQGGQSQGQSETPSGGQQQGKQGGLSATAKARKEKLETASQQPPDLSSLGTAGDGTEVTETDIENMSDDEIADLPDGLKRKLFPDLYQ